MIDILTMRGFEKKEAIEDFDFRWRTRHLNGMVDIPAMIKELDAINAHFKTL